MSVSGIIDLHNNYPSIFAIITIIKAYKLINQESISEAAISKKYRINAEFFEILPEGSGLSGRLTLSIPKS